jgi:hypothetical protein
MSKVQLNNLVSLVTSIVSHITLTNKVTISIQGQKYAIQVMDSSGDVTLSIYLIYINICSTSLSCQAIIFLKKERVT